MKVEGAILLEQHEHVLHLRAQQLKFPIMRQSRFEVGVSDIGLHLGTRGRSNGDQTGIVCPRRLRANALLGKAACGRSPDSMAIDAHNDVQKRCSSMTAPETRCILVPPVAACRLAAPIRGLTSLPAAAAVMWEKVTSQ